MQTPLLGVAVVSICFLALLASKHRNFSVTTAKPGSFLYIPNTHFPVFFGFFGLVILDTCTPFFEMDAVCVPVLMKSFFMGITSLLTYS